MAAVNFPDSPSPGQIFYSPNNGAAYIYGTNGVWSQYGGNLSEDPIGGTVGGVYVGIQPSNPVVGLLWFPTGPGTIGLGYIWTGAEWKVLNEGKVGSGAAGDRPSAPDTGDLFYNANTGILEVYNGVSWINIQAGGGATNITFTSTTGLVSTNVGAAIDETHAKVLTNIAGIATAQSTADNAQTTADGAQFDAAQALLDASAAQADATQALGDAAAAQADANQAIAAAATAQATADANSFKIGDLTTLTTTSKTSAVSAINEVQSETNAAQATASAALPRSGGTMTGELVTRTLDIQSGFFLEFANGVAGQQSGISDSTSTPSSTVAASSTAVKSAYDLANTAKNTADQAVTDLGDLTNLQTTDKTNAVAAINELEGRIDILGSSLIYGGTYNATTNQVASVTQAGTDAGLVVGSALSTGGLTTNVFVIITVNGTGTPPAPAILLEAGNWLISNGTAWDYLQLGIPTTNASLVTYTPTGTVSSTNVQSAIAELDSEKVPTTRQVIAGTGLDGGGALSANVTLSLEPSGATAGNYGGDGQIPNIQVDTYGRITSVSEVSASLGGLSDVDVSTTPPTEGQFLVYDGVATQWEPRTVDVVTNDELNATKSNFIYVDATNGNDATGLVGDMTRPFKTIKAALAVASSPNMVVVSEGTYTELNPISVPSGVQIISACGNLGWIHTNVIPNNLLEDLFIFQGDACGISGLTLRTPSALGKAAIAYSGPAGTTTSATFVGIEGVAGGQGTGVLNKSVTTAEIIIHDARYQGGDMETFIECRGGTIDAESITILDTLSGGSPRIAFKQSNSLGATVSRLEIINSNCENSGTVHAFETTGGKATFSVVNWKGATNGVHIASNSYEVLVNGGLIDCATSILVDSGLTGANGRLGVYAQMNNSFSYPFTWSDSDYTFEFSTKKTDPNSRTVSKQLHGADFIVGEHHKGHGLVVGQGGAFKDGLAAFTSNSTATSTTDGGNITNITAAVVEKTAPTFTFQGVGVNHCIYFGTNELDENGTYIRHYGVDIDVVTGDSRDGDYAIEIWSGTQWVEVGSQAVSNSTGFSYGNNHFWRSDSNETTFYGIRSATTWATKTIGGVTAYWSRIRIADAPTTLPTFNTASLLPGGSMGITSEGVIEKFGNAIPAIVNAQGSNIFSENGNVTSYTFTMGSGTNAYTHTINNVVLDQVGEGLYWQTAIVPGICTALPIFIDVGYSLTTTTTVAPTFDIYFQPVETSGTLIADPTGGKTPIPRPEALTVPFTGVGAQNPTKLTVSLPYLTADKLHRVRFGPFNITDFYEGDAIAIQFQLASRGTPLTTAAIWGVAVIGYEWTEGIRGY